MQRFQRSGDDGWFQAGQIQVTTSVFLSATTAVSIVLWVASKTAFVEPFYLSGGHVRSGQVWRLVTWPFVNNPDIWIIVSIAMMYLVGSDIEREMGRRRFLALIVALTVVPAIAGTAFDIRVEFGLPPIVSALFIVLVLWRPTARWFLDIPLWIVVVVFEGIYVLQILDGRDWGRLAFWAVGAVVATLMTRSFGMTEFEQIPRVPLPQFITQDPYQKSNREREKRQRAQQRGSSKPGGGSRPGARRKGAEGNVVPMRDSARPEPRLDRAAQTDMDALLDKISETGVTSLNEHERRRLDELSRRLRGEG